MSLYSRSITPDSLSGALFALEGVRRSVVTLNGPTGCKFYHSATSDNQLIRQVDFDPMKFPPQWFFGQPRIPCTYLDNYDYVYGSADKLAEMLRAIRDNIDFDLLGVVNSPGAALIGDDVAGVARSVLGGRRVVVLETPGFSQDVSEGYSMAMEALVEQLGLEGGDPRPMTVNVLGESIFHRNMLGDCMEVARLLGLCGVEVSCFLGAGCSMGQVLSAPTASLNVAIHREYGQGVARLLERRFGTPALVCDGPPVGFDASERFVRGVCGMLGADPAPALESIERARGRAFAFVSRVHSITGMPKGVSYSIEGYVSELLSWVEALTGYLGMAPAAVSVVGARDDEGAGRLRSLLDGYGFASALGKDALAEPCDIVLGSGNLIAAHRATGSAACGVEIALPTLGYYDVEPKTFMGAVGGLHLVEMVLNSLPF